MTRNRSCHRRLLAAAAVLVCAAALTARPALAQTGGGNIHVLFTQQDVVQAFDLVTGKGYQVGTATGQIAGTTFVEFQFTPTEPPTTDPFSIAFTNKVTITDLDGDQLYFDNTGTGTFHLGIAPGFSGSGGPLTGTYVVTGGTGKFADWKVGTTFTYRAIATNPPTPPGGFGNVFVEISYHDRGKR